jgi:hypothetical protein
MDLILTQETITTGELKFKINIKQICILNQEFSLYPFDLKKKLNLLIYQLMHQNIHHHIQSAMYTPTKTLRVITTCHSS